MLRTRLAIGGVLAVKMELVANLDEEEDAGVVRLAPPDLLLEGVIFAAPEGWSRSTDGSSASRPRRSVPSRRRGSRVELEEEGVVALGTRRRDGRLEGRRGDGRRGGRAGSLGVVRRGVDRRARDRDRVAATLRRGRVGWASDPTTTGVSSRVSATGGFAGVEAGRRLLEEEGGDRTLRLGRAGVPPPPGLSRFIAEAPEDGKLREVPRPRRSADASSRSRASKPRRRRCRRGSRSARVATASSPQARALSSASSQKE